MSGQRSVVHQEVGVVVFGILGPVTVWDTAGRPVTLRRRKARWLLCLLLRQRNRDVPTGWLIDGLWGAAPPVSAQANLHNYLSDLRRALVHTAAAGALQTTAAATCYRCGPASSTRIASPT
jgi:DNA-binding SARP family transcriptional activator